MSCASLQLGDGPLGDDWYNTKVNQTTNGCNGRIIKVISTTDGTVKVRYEGTKSKKLELVSITDLRRGWIQILSLHVE